jgi:hypothetical protein
VELKSYYLGLNPNLPVSRWRLYLLYRSAIQSYLPRRRPASNFVGVGAFAGGSPTTYLVAATAPIACPSPPPSPGPSSGIGTGTIVLYVVLGVAGLLALAGAVVWWQRRERQRSLSHGFAVLGDDVTGASAATNIDATELPVSGGRYCTSTSTCD